MADKDTVTGNVTRMNGNQRYSDIPDELIVKFFEYVQEPDVKVERIYSYTTDGDERLSQKRVVQTSKPLKSSLELFQTLYPEYFDRLNYQKVKKLLKENSGEKHDDQTFIEQLKKALD